jgi:Streptomycin adenylyltransferase
LSLLPNHQDFVTRFVKLCVSDERVVAAFLGGSNAKGYADSFSDLDLCVITTDAAFDEFYRQREAFLQLLGNLVFLEDFGNPNSAFYIFADGTEGELNFGSEDHLDRIHSGEFKTLLDKKGILTDATFPEKEADAARQRGELRHNIYVFWHELSHFITAIGRRKLWWARGQLEALRSICVNLARLQHDFMDAEVGEEPYFKIEYAMNVEVLSPLEPTFCPMEKDAMLKAAQIILQFYAETAQPLAQAHEVPYPSDLAMVMLNRFNKLTVQML